MNQNTHDNRQFCGGRFRFEDWTGTARCSSGDAFLISFDDQLTFFDTVKLNAIYPGFDDGFCILHNLGCDCYFVTHVLKYCIYQKDLGNIVDVLNKPGLLDAIKTAVALDVSADTIVTTFEQWRRSAGDSPVLPVDLGYIG